MEMATESSTLSVKGKDSEIRMHTSTYTWTDVVEFYNYVTTHEIARVELD